MLHRITILSAALVFALLALPLGVLSQGGETAGQSTSEEVSIEQPEGDTAAEEASEAQEEQEETEQVEESTETVETTGEGDAEETEQAEDIQIRVLMSDGTVETMELEEYLWGVLAAEMPANFWGEALKAQAVAARTYTLYQMEHPKDAHPEADVCTDYTCCQAWISREDRLAQWPEEEQENYAGRISAALRLTAGEILTWDGDPILAVFHASSAGWTRSAASVWGTDVPYLVSVESPEGEGDAPNYYSVVTMSGEEFSALFLDTYPEADLSGAVSDWFSAPETDENGMPCSYVVGGVTVTVQELRSLCGLRSATFTVECSEDEVTFYVTGYGHGVGMSQYGANVLAGQGLSYQEILEHYYPGTELVQE